MKVEEVASVVVVVAAAAARLGLGFGGKGNVVD